MNYEYTVSGLKAANIIGVADASAHTLERAEAIGAILEGWWVAEMKPLVTTHVSLESVGVLDMNSETGISIEYTTSLPVAGTNGGQASPVQASPLVTFTSAGRGRSSRGRNYIVGAPADAFEGGDGTQMNVTYRADYLAAYEALGTAIAAGDDAQHAILSVKTVTAVEVTGYELRGYLGTQRRRASSP